MDVHMNMRERTREGGKPQGGRDRVGREGERERETERQREREECKPHLCEHTGHLLGNLGTQRRSGYIDECLTVHLFLRNFDLFQHLKNTL